jgi:hypothetical protein
VAAVAPGAPVPRPAAPAPSPSRHPSLFEPEPAPAKTPVAPSSWVDQLLASPTFVANRQRVRLPRPIADERIRSYLGALDANGGSMPLQVLSTRTGEPADTLRMALTLVQRLVNLDGAEVLAVRGDGTVELNRALAVLQFGLSNR